MITMFANIPESHTQRSPEMNEEVKFHMHIHIWIQGNGLSDQLTGVAKDSTECDHVAKLCEIVCLGDMF